jgi:hypothetical protein
MGIHYRRLLPFLFDSDAYGVKLIGRPLLLGSMRKCQKYDLSGSSPSTSSSSPLESKQRSPYWWQRPLYASLPSKSVPVVATRNQLLSLPVTLLSLCLNVLTIDHLIPMLEVSQLSYKLMNDYLSRLHHVILINPNDYINPRIMYALSSYLNDERLVLRPWRRALQLVERSCRQIHILDLGPQLFTNTNDRNIIGMIVLRHATSTTKGVEPTLQRVIPYLNPMIINGIDRFHELSKCASLRHFPSFDNILEPNIMTLTNAAHVCPFVDTIDISSVWKKPHDIQLLCSAILPSFTNLASLNLFHVEPLIMSSLRLPQLTKVDVIFTDNDITSNATNCRTSIGLFLSIHSRTLNDFKVMMPHRSIVMNEANNGDQSISWDLGNITRFHLSQMIVSPRINGDKLISLTIGSVDINNASSLMAINPSLTSIEIDITPPTYISPDWSDLAPLNHVTSFTIGGQLNNLSGLLSSFPRMPSLVNLMIKAVVRTTNDDEILHLLMWCPHLHSLSLHHLRSMQTMQPTLTASQARSPLMSSSSSSSLSLSSLHVALVLALPSASLDLTSHDNLTNLDINMEPPCSMTDIVSDKPEAVTTRLFQRLRVPSLNLLTVKNMIIHDLLPFVESCASLSTLVLNGITIRGASTLTIPLIQLTSLVTLNSSRANLDIDIACRCPRLREYRVGPLRSCHIAAMSTRLPSCIERIDIHAGPHQYQRRYINYKRDIPLLVDTVDRLTNGNLTWLQMAPTSSVPWINVAYQAIMTRLKKKQVTHPPFRLQDISISVASDGPVQLGEWFDRDSYLSNLLDSDTDDDNNDRDP